MKERPSNSRSKTAFPLPFFVLVFMVSAPVWMLGAVAGQSLPEDMPINVFSSLSVFCPTIAAVILVQRESGLHGVKQLLKRSLDYKKIKEKAWYGPILFLMPIMMVLAYGLMAFAHAPLPDPQIPILMVPVLFLVFFIAGLGEETGWQGYAIDPLQERGNALTASIILGIVWAIWHVGLFVQLDHTPTWIAWQCMGMIATRILIVWLYNNTGQSVFAAVLFHAMNNLGSFLFPHYGSHYDPFFACIVMGVTAAVVIFLWGPATLARYRYSRLGQDVHPLT